MSRTPAVALLLVGLAALGAAAAREGNMRQVERQGDVVSRSKPNQSGTLHERAARERAALAITSSDAPFQPVLPALSEQRCDWSNVSTAAALAPVLNGSALLEYGSEQVISHFHMQPRPTTVDRLQSTYACVDARGDEQLLGTPGGDLAEIVSAIQAYFKTYPTLDINRASIRALFDTFATRVASPARPIYFHTDDSRIRRLLTLAPQSNGVPASVLPKRGPSDPADAEAWLALLVQAEYQGCGHIRLMLESPAAYSVARSGPASEAAACTNANDIATCANSATIAAEVIRAFFEYWWFSAPNSPERQNVRFSVDLGPLIGKAVAAIDSTSTCGADAVPAVKPNFGGSTVFVYHGSAVGAWRQHVARQRLQCTTGAFCTGPAWFRPATGAPLATTVSNFVASWDAIHQRQLGATLTLLPPANAIPLIAVTLTGTR